MRKIKKIRRPVQTWRPYAGDEADKGADANLFAMIQEVEDLYARRSWRGLETLLAIAATEGSFLEAEAALRFTTSYRKRETWNTIWNRYLKIVVARMEESKIDPKTHLIGMYP